MKKKREHFTLYSYFILIFIHNIFVDNCKTCWEEIFTQCCFQQRWNWFLCNISNISPIFYTIFFCDLYIFCISSCRDDDDSKMFFFALGFRVKIGVFLWVCQSLNAYLSCSFQLPWFTFCSFCFVFFVLSSQFSS
jgi:hypothetical protein